MLFEPVSAAHREPLTAAFSANPSRSYDECFGNIYIWRRVFDTHTAFSGGFAFVRFRTPEHLGYLVPTGNIYDREALAWALERIAEDSRTVGMPYLLVSVTEEQRLCVEAATPAAYRFGEARDSFDYIYLAENLRFLPGKKYHGKRNHISQYEAAAPILYEPLTPGNAEECLDFSMRWYALREASPELESEKLAVTEALQNFEAAGLEGGVLRLPSGAVTAFAAGERLTGDTFCVHIEKATAEIPGAYSVINREFARAMGGYKYINREEDTGSEGLRRAKLSYHPELLLTKYVGHTV